MRQDKLLNPTLREAPSEAEAISHQLLLRAGYIRQVAAGIYTYLPNGWRVLKKISDIVRQEMDQIDAQELLMPAMQPTELWRESGRYSIYGQELIRFQDRHQREFALGPTHEEVITTLVRNEVSSYRKLPILLYQIQTKFRDERRPRFGLLRGREFLMKDAYSFDTDWKGLEQTYWSVFDAYSRIFTRCNLNFRPVEAEAGAIGGEGGTHEFMALADIGEDTVVSCTNCDYAANLEKAEAAAPHLPEPFEASPPVWEKFHTPNVKRIQELAAFTGIEAKMFVKTLIYTCDGNRIAVLVRGDHEVNEIKLKNFMAAETLELTDSAQAEEVTGAPIGFAGPVGLAIPVLADRDVAVMRTITVGANEQDHHLRNVVPGRDFTISDIGDLRNVVEADCCPRCSGSLQFHRGIELGHVFKLGTKYSEKLGAKYSDAAGKEQVMIMGCYGIGISRMISAIVEQHHDQNGIIWPASIAPYQVHLILISPKDEIQVQVAETLYLQLRKAGVEVLLDDREERPGVKFKDADLIGIPLQIIVGKQAYEGLVEYKERGSHVKVVESVDEAIIRAKKIMGQ